MQKEKKPKKILFSAEIDSALNGYAIGISFLGIGLFLLLNPTYFFLPIISYIIGAIIGAIGVLGTGIELSKSSKIKGMDNLCIGLIFSGIWLFSYFWIKTLWGNIIFFIFLIFGLYALLLGLFQGLYSIVHNYMEQKNENHKKSIGTLLSQFVLFMTQVCSLVIAILNIIKAINT